MRLRDRSDTLTLGVLALGAALSAGCQPPPTCEGEWCGTAIIVANTEADVLLPPVTTQDVGISVSDQIFWKLADVGPGMQTLLPSTFEPRLADRGLELGRSTFTWAACSGWG